MAIINGYGAWDVGDLLSGPNVTDCAVSWFGTKSNRSEIARQVSPHTYFGAGLPSFRAKAIRPMSPTGW